VRAYYRRHLIKERRDEPYSLNVRELYEVEAVPLSYHTNRLPQLKTLSDAGLQSGNTANK
jgi:hypothetical protein